MLHIEIEERAGTGVVLALSGELSGVSPLALMERWRELRRNCREKVCVVDLSSVSAMDEAGQRAIRALAHDGVRFLARGPMLDIIIDMVWRASVEASQAECAGFRSIVFNG